MLANEVSERRFRQLGPDLLLPHDVALGGVQADQEQLQIFLIAAGVGAAFAFAAFAFATLAKAKALGDSRAVARITSDKNLVAGNDGARCAHAGHLDLEKEIVLGPLDRQVLVVRDASLGTAESRPIASAGQRPQSHTRRQQGGSETASNLHGNPPEWKKSVCLG